MGYLPAVLQCSYRLRKKRNIEDTSPTPKPALLTLHPAKQDVVQIAIEPGLLRPGLLPDNGNKSMHLDSHTIGEIKQTDCLYEWR